MKLCAVCHRVYPDGATACSEHGERLRADPLIGTRVGSFRVDGWLGEGGMGVLYHAEHEAIGRTAAVKVIRREMTANETLAGRFEQEARSVARIGHPNLIDIFDIGTTADGRLYYVMELLAGEALSAAMARGRLPFDRFVPLVRQTCAGLEATHAVGIVHRDLKPDNLFLVERAGEPPLVKVLDFGVAKMLDEDSAAGEERRKLTQTGSIVGTPQYMAPEQIDGARVDSRADVYALGVILYELATGRLPFTAQTLGGMLRAHLLEAPPTFSPDELSPGVPPALEAVVFKAMARKPGERYASVAELRDDLDRVAAGAEPEAAAWWREKRLASDTLVTGGPMAQGGTQVLRRTAVATIASGERSRARRGHALHWAVFALLAVVDIAVSGFAGVRRQRAQVPPAVASGPAVARAAARARGPDLPALRSRALGVLTAALADGDPAVRQQALEAIAGGHEAPHRTMIEPLLADPVGAVRGTAARSLGQLGSPDAIPALEALLGKDAVLDPPVAQALLDLRDEGRRKDIRSQLHRRLRERGVGDEVKLGAALVLVDLDDHEARRLLETRAASERPGDAARVNALAALARRGSARARAALVAALERDDEAMQLLAAERLARIGAGEGPERLLRIASDEKSALRLLAYRILAGLDDQSGYDAFAAALPDAGRPVAERVLAAQGLACSGEKAALDGLTPLLADTETALRVAAAGAVLAIAGSDPKVLAARSLEWATRALSDASALVRQQAVAVLADADPSLSLPLLGRALQDGEVEVRRAAARSLGRTRSVQAVALLDRALDDATPEVRREALESIERIGDRQTAAPVLARFYEKAAPDERLIAAGGMAALGDSSHLDELKQAIGSTSATLRRIAIEKSALLLAAPSPEGTRQALLAALGDHAFGVRLAAAAQLAESGVGDGVPVLKQGVARGGVDALRAYAALGRLGMKSERPPAQLLDAPDPEARQRAVEGAGRLAPAEALGFLRRALKDPAPAVRIAAVEAAGDFAAAGPAPGRKAFVALLQGAFHDADPAVRARAGGLVARIAPPPAEPAVPEPPRERQPVAAASPQEGTPGKPDAPAANGLPPGAAGAAPPPAPVVAAADPAAAPQPPARAGRPVPSLDAGKQEEANLALASGELALKSGNYKAAITQLNRAHRINKRLPVSFSLGEAYRKMGDREIDPGRQRDSYRTAIANYRRASSATATSYAEELEVRLKER